MKPVQKNERRIPRYQKEWRSPGVGQFKAKLYTEFGLVEVFSYAGGDYGEAFTALEMFIHPHVYTRRIGRHYHTRWIHRIASHFAWDCHRESERI